jgi:hypothetical protein
LVAVSLLALELSACVGPARSASSYRLKVRGSAKTALSAVATATFAAQLVRDNGAFATYLSVVLDSAEGDVTSTESTFASIQPPDRESDALREEFDGVLNDAGSAVSSMRISARRQEWSALLEAAKELPRLSDELRRYAELPA